MREREKGVEGLGIARRLGFVEGYHRIVAG